MAEYYTVLTNKGAEKVASYLAGGPRIELALIAVGDGGGASFYTNYTRPQLRARTSLVNQRWADALYLVEKDADNPAWVITEGRVPAETGGWYIREVGIFDKAGDLIAIGVYPETYKPVLSNGIGTDLTIRSIIEVGDATSVTITIDPSVVQATREWVHQHKVDKNQIGNTRNLIPMVGHLSGGLDLGVLGLSAFCKNISQTTDSDKRTLLLVRKESRGDFILGTIQGTRNAASEVGSRCLMIELMLCRGTPSPWSVHFTTARGGYSGGAGLVIVEHEGEDWVALKLDGSGPQAILNQASFTGQFGSTSEKQLTWVTTQTVSNERPIDELAQHPMRYRGRPGDQIGNNTAWHSGNTLVDSNGFIKQA